VATKSSQNQAVASARAEAVAELTQPNTSIWGRWLGILGVAIALASLIWALVAHTHSDPYVSSVLQLTGDAGRGKEIFITNCATCHGLEAGGEVGPDLHSVSERKSRRALIEQVISGKTPPMPQFQPNEKDMADLLSFLETL